MTAPVASRPRAQPVGDRPSGLAGDRSAAVPTATAGRSLDRRLLSVGRATRANLAVSIALGTATAVLVVGQAWLLATVVSGAFVDGEGLAAMRAMVVALLGVVVLRALVAWYTEVAADRCSALVKSELRRALVARAAVPGRRGQVARRPGDVVTLASGGIDALDAYYSRYLPQLVLAVIVPPTVLIAVGSQDWISAAIIVVTVPLIPVFMALIGFAARRRTDRQLRTLQVLSGHFLDVVAGLSTLRIFGRSKAQTETIRSVTDRYRRATMGTLRLAFLSSLALELLASVAVALVAVSVGLRLLYGHLDLQTSLFVLVLAPEAYLPLRLVGANYHASAEGLSAAEQVFAVLDEPLRASGTRTGVPNPARTGVVVEGLRVTYPGRDRPALDGVTLNVAPGKVTAVTGPTGCGKSTLLSALVGLVVPDSGSVRVAGIDLADLDPQGWRTQLAWVPQRPYLFASSLGENVCLGRPDAPPDAVAEALSAAGLTELVARLPDGLDTRLGERGAGLSAGERQRVALARAFVRDAPLLLLDEPTANLDGLTEDALIEAIRRLARGRTVVLVAHRAALLALADHVVSLVPSEVVVG